jgi:hypothetical protein
LKGEDSAGTNHPGNGIKNCNGVGKIHQNETTHRCVKRLVAGDLINVALDEPHIIQAGLGHASPGPCGRARVAFYAYHFSGGTDGAGCQHGDVPDARAKVQDALTCADARFTEQSFRKRSQTRGLPDETLVLSVSVAKRIGRSDCSGCRLRFRRILAPMVRIHF